jgi:hypothetical protein
VVGDERGPGCPSDISCPVREALDAPTAEELPADSRLRHFFRPAGQTSPLVAEARRVLSVGAQIEAESAARGERMSAYHYERMDWARGVLREHRS